MNNKEYKYYFSIVTGQVVKILPDEVNLLEIYQIPLNKRPNTSCKKCYGRGYSSITSDTKLHNPCSCVIKVIDNSVFKNKEITFFMPKY